MSALRIFLVIAVGCLATTARAGADEPPCAPPCQTDHVYVFLMNGLDFHLSQMPGMRDYVRGLGYCHVYYGELTAGPRFLKEIRRIHADDPCARIVLVGYSLGANEFTLVVHALKADCIQIDLLVYIGSVLVYNGPLARPDNALRVVNIRDSGLTISAGLVRGANVDGADNVELPGRVFHLGTPGNPVLREVLANELAAVAGAPAAPPPAEQP